MKIEVAAHAGFCFGVRRSVSAVDGLLASGKRITTLGPVIHNPAVIEGMKARGVVVAEEKEEVEGDTVVIRAHGAPKSVHDYFLKKGMEVVDTTCPFVERIHRRVREASAQGIPVLIVGEKEHAEVAGIRGWVEGSDCFIVYSAGEIDALPPLQRACVVAQTTTPQALYDGLCAHLRERIPECEVFGSICKATVLHQSEARELAARVDVMLVVGGRNSSNTRKLFALCSEICKRTYFIEKAEQVAGIPVTGNEIIGITAGASTPDEIIKEVVTRMSELDKTITPQTDAPVEAQDSAQDSEFAAEFEKTLVSIRPGQTVTGTIVQVTDNEVCVNIGYKSDGLIPVAELINQENHREAYKVGDEIEVEVVKVNDGEGNVLLSQKNIVSRKNWDALVAKYENNEYVEGVGKDVVKGGLIVDVDGVRTFVPASQLSERYVEKIDQFVGKPMKLKIIEVDKQKRRLVASRKAVLAEESAAAKAAAWEKLEVGTIVHGIVRRLTDFGAFVDIGGVDGLIHITDLSWGRVKHPSDVVKPGDEVDVLVLALDRERERISLGLKQTKPKPWETAQVNYPVGSICEGKVVRIVTFGAFVELEPGLDGLVHISQIAPTRINKVEDVLHVGDMVRVRILDVNPEAKRISLSIRDAAEPAEAENGDMELGDLPDEI